MFVLEFLLRIFYEYPILTVGTMLAAGYKKRCGLAKAAIVFKAAPDSSEPLF